MLMSTPARPTPKWSVADSVGSCYEASGYTMLDLISRAYNLPWKAIAADHPGSAPIGRPHRRYSPRRPRERFTAHDPGCVGGALPAQGGRRNPTRSRLRAVIRQATPPQRQHRRRVAMPEKRDRSTITLNCTNMPMNQFARELKDYAQEFFDRPLGDKTGLTGSYDFSLTWTQRDQMRVRNAEGELTGITPQTALEKQLGLECVLSPEPMKVLVIDSVSRVPTPNAPGVIEGLNSSTYTHFDVAEVRSHKEETGFKYDDQETQITYLGFTLPVLIDMAWNTPPQKRQVVGPDWIKTEKFISSPSLPTGRPGNMQLMLRTLGGGQSRRHTRHGGHARCFFSPGARAVQAGSGGARRLKANNLWLSRPMIRARL